MKRLFLFVPLCFLFFGCMSTKSTKYEYEATAYSTISYEDAAQKAIYKMKSERPELLNEDANNFNVYYFNPSFFSINSAYECWLFGDPDSTTAKETRNSYLSMSAANALGDNDSVWNNYLMSHYFYGCSISHYSSSYLESINQSAASE